MTAFGAKRDENGEIILYHGGMNFQVGSFSQMAWYEISSKGCRSKAAKIRKAERVISKLEEMED